MGSFLIGGVIGLYAWLIAGAYLLAEAANVESGSLWEGVVKALIGIAATAISVGITVLLTGLAKKAKVEVSAKNQEMIRKATYEAIMFVAEKAALEKKLGEQAMKSEEKLKVATARLVDKIPGISQVEAEKLVTESLADVGEGAVIAVGKLAEAALTPDGAE